MFSVSDEKKTVSNEIVRESCAQCGYGEAVCSAVPVAEGRSRFKTCPRCGCSEALTNGETRRWKGYGVFVLESGPGIVKAGAFPRAIPDEKVSRIVERFNELGSTVRYVTRWNERESRVEVLLGVER
jgi:hypothetical protein